LPRPGRLQVRDHVKGNDSLTRSTQI
jgi:hypothetical protein